MSGDYYDNNTPTYLLQAARRSNNQEELVQIDLRSVNRMGQRLDAAVRPPLVEISPE